MVVAHRIHLYIDDGHSHVVDSALMLLEKDDEAEAHMRSRAGVRRRDENNQAVVEEVWYMVQRRPWEIE